MDFVGELVAVDGAAAAPCAGGVAGLDHEVGDDAVDDGVIVVVALGEGGEIGACLREDVREEADRWGGSKEMDTLGA